MNIQAQMCGLVLMLVLLFFFIRRKTLGLNTQIVFHFVMGITILCITMDILSVVVICSRDSLPLWFVKLVCKLYLVTLVFEGMFGLLYVYADICRKQKAFKRRAYVCVAVAVVFAVAVLAHPIYIFQEGWVVYTEGPSDIITYIGAVGFVVYNAMLLIIKRKQIVPRRSKAVAVWLVIWIGSAVIQFCNSELLLVGYSTAIGVTIIYLRLENPEFMTDRATGLFNQAAFLDYTGKLFNQNKDFAVLSVTVTQGSRREHEGEQEQELLLSVAGPLFGLPKSRSFKISEDEVLVVIDDMRWVDIRVRDVRRIFEAGIRKYPDMLGTQYILIPSARKIGDAKDVLRLIRYAEMRSSDFGAGNFINADEDMLLQMRKEVRMAGLIAEAMEKDRIEVFYQPIYSTKKRCFTSAEALVRMRDEQGRLIPPVQFIPVAEANGMITRLGELMFEKVCRFIKEHNVIRYGIEYIEVNLSIVQCASPKLAERYKSIIEKYGIDPKWINLEITESASLEAKQILLENMHRLIEYGVHFSLDDFGTGQSNLNYIVDMPVSIVKFDRDMTNAYFENGKAKYVMGAAMHMIQGMGLEIVSEGIEKKEQYEVLAQLGIDYIQGYYFSKPLPEPEFMELIQKQKRSGGAL